MKRLWPWTRLPPFWAGSIVAMEATYLLAFLRPFSLLEHYQTPGLDLGKLGQYSVEGALSYTLAMGVLFLIYALAFRRAVQGRVPHLAWIVAGGLLFAATAGAVYPIGALDVFDNIFYGRMAAFLGGNPLISAPDAFSGDELYRYVAWTWWPIPYGPIWAAVDALLSRLTGGELLAGLVAFKVLGVAMYAACMLLIAALLRRLWPGYVTAGTLLFAWSPVVILEGMANAHNDLTFMVLVLAALLLHLRGRSLWGLGALLASVLLKFVSLALVPLYLVAAWREACPEGIVPRASPRSGSGQAPRGAWGRAGFLAGAGGMVALATLALYLPYVVPGEEWQTLATRPFRQANLFTTSLPAVVTFLMEKAWDQQAVQSVVRQMAMGGWAVFTAWQTWRLARGPSGPAELAVRSYRVLLYFLLLACLWFQPWYLIWLLALAPLLGPGFEAAAVILFSVLVQSKYLIFDFVWFWRTPMDDIIVPEVATTLLIFGPMLGMYAWRAWRCGLRPGPPRATRTRPRLAGQASAPGGRGVQQSAT